MPYNKPVAKVSRVANGTAHVRSPLARSRYAEVKISGELLTVSFVYPQALTLGLAHREKEANRRVRKQLRRVKTVEIERLDGLLQASFPRHSAHALAAALKAIDRDLNALMQEKLHPALVEELLGITPRERIRWTKDGRLQQAGSGSFSNGAQPIGFALYRPSEIADLARNAGIIQAWRDADAAQIAPQLTGS